MGSSRRVPFSPEYEKQMISENRDPAGWGILESAPVRGRPALRIRIDAAYPLWYTPRRIFTFAASCQSTKQLHRSDGAITPRRFFEMKRRFATDGVEKNDRREFSARED
jgi:hypothetical protein